MTGKIKNVFSEKNQQVLSGISQLQQTEKELYSNLSLPNLSESEKQRIINQINELSQMRLNMYESLQNLHTLYQTNVDNLNTMADVQAKSIDAMENELNQYKIHLNSIDQMKINKLRTIEINNYYAKRYNSYKNIMFIISISCVPILLLTTLNNNMIIPTNIYSVLVSLIVILSSYVIFKQYLDISNRDNLNWDSYSWYFSKENAPEQDETNENANNENKDEFEEQNVANEVCTGSECCQEGTLYDSNINRCVPI